MAVRHLFLWSVEGEEQGAAVLAELTSLEDRVPGLRNWTIGRHDGELLAHGAEPRRFDYVLSCDFAGPEDLQAYQDHPAHQEVTQRVMPLYSDWAVVDLQLSP